jgi:hypothetical protein
MTESVPYHSILWDTEKLFANLARNVGVALESFGGIFEQPEALGVAVLFELGAFGLDGLRWADAVAVTALTDTRKLFQPT